METWYHVVIYPKAFGFAAENGFVTKTPYEYSWMLHKSLKELKPFLLKEKAIVTEIKYKAWTGLD